MAADIILQIIFLVLYAVFTFAETAVIMVNDNNLEKLAASGGKKASRLKQLVEHPSRFMSSLHAATLFTGFLGASFAALNFSQRLYVSAAVITIAVLYFTVVIGELVPKRLARKNPEKLALKLSGAIVFISRLFTPLVWLSKLLSDGILRHLRHHRLRFHGGADEIPALLHLLRRHQRSGLPHRGGLGMERPGLAG